MSSDPFDVTPSNHLPHRVLPNPPVNVGIQMAIQIEVAELIGESPIISLGLPSFTDPKLKLGWIKRRMAQPRVAGRNQLPQKWARGIVINEEIVAPRATVSKLCPKGGKGKGKGHVQPTPTEGSSDIEGVYSTHLTISESEGHSNGSSPASVSKMENDQLLQLSRAELCSKSMKDPSRILVPPTPHPPLAPSQVVVQAPPFV
uniref:Integrase core domain containing protein n=1 Tax=Solanum tuberosum TaxID=4113 RepID=M1DG65_SOLTU